MAVHPIGRGMAGAGRFVAVVVTSQPASDPCAAPDPAVGTDPEVAPDPVAGTDQAAAPDPAAGTDPQQGGGVLVRRIATYLPSSIIPAALTLLTSVVFTRIFDPTAFGLYSLFLVVATPVKLICTTWVTQSMGKYLPAANTADSRARAKSAIGISTLSIFVVETLLAGAAFAGFGLVLSGPSRGLLLPALLFVVVSSLFEVLYLVFPMENRAREFVAYRLTDAVLTFALRLALVSAAFRMGIALMFWSVVVSNGVLVPVMWWRAGLGTPTRVLSVLRSSQVRRLTIAFLAFGLPMTIWYFSGILLDVGDRYVLNFLLGPAPVGVYDANYRLMSGLAALLASPITITLHPYLMSISGSGDRDRIGTVIATIVEKLLIAGAICVGVTFLLHRELARVLLGPQFRAGSLIMPLVLAGVFLFNVGLFAHKPFEIIGRTRVMVSLGLLSAAANVGLCFALIPPLGYVGAAYATVLAYGLYSLAVGVLGRRVYPWRLDLRRLAVRLSWIGGGVALVWLLRRAGSGLPYPWVAVLTALASGGLGALALVAFVLRSASPAGATPASPDASPADSTPDSTPESPAAPPDGASPAPLPSPAQPLRHARRSVAGWYSLRRRPYRHAVGPLPASETPAGPPRLPFAAERPRRDQVPAQLPPAGAAGSPFAPGAIPAPQLSQPEPRSVPD